MSGETMPCPFCFDRDETPRGCACNGRGEVSRFIRFEAPGIPADSPAEVDEERMREIREMDLEAWVRDMA